MRFVTGIVVGAILVIGAAYIHDASVDPGRDPAARTMVNWPVVSENIRSLGGWAQDQLDRLTGKGGPG